MTSSHKTANFIISYYRKCNLFTVIGEKEREEIEQLVFILCLPAP